MADETTVKGIKIIFKSDTVEFENSVKGVNQAMYLLKAETASLNKQLKFDPKNVTLLNKKAEELKKTIKLNETNIKKFKTELEALDKTKVGEKEWVSLQKQISRAEGELANFKGILKNTQKEINNLGNSQIINILTQNLDKAAKSFENAGKKLLPLSGILVAGFGKATKNASDLLEAISKTEVAFGDSSQEILKFTEKSARKFGENQSTVLDTASTLGLLGLEAEKVKISLERIADVGALQNRSFQQVADDFTSAMNGSTKSVQKYGIKLRSLDLQQYLVEKGVVNNTKAAKIYIDTLNSEGRQLLYLEKILKDTTNATGFFAKETDQVAVSSKVLKATWDETLIQLGDTLAPVLAKINVELTKLLEKFNKLTPAQKQNVVTIGLLVTALGPLLIIIGKIIKLFSFLASVVGKIIGIFKALQAGKLLALINVKILLIAGAIMAVVTAIYFVIKYFDKIVEFFKAFWKKIKNIGKEISDWFDAKVKAFTEKAEQIRNSIYEKFKEIVDWIIEKINIGIESILNFFIGIGNFFVDVFNRAKSAVQGFFEAISLKAIDLIVGAFNGLLWVLEKIGNAFSWVGSLFKGFFGGGKNNQLSFNQNIINSGGFMASGGFGSYNYNNQPLTINAHFSGQSNLNDKLAIRKMGNQIYKIVKEEFGRNK